MEHTNEMGKKLPRQTKKTILKMVINSILILVGIVWVILQLSALQKTSAENTQKKHSTAMLDAILVSMERNESEIVELTRQYDSMNKEILISLGSLLNENTAFSKAFMGANNSVRTEFFQNNGIQIPFPQIVVSQRKDTEEEARIIKQRLENDQQ